MLGLFVRLIFSKCLLIFGSVLFFLVASGFCGFWLSWLLASVAFGFWLSWLSSHAKEGRQEGSKDDGL